MAARLFLGVRAEFGGKADGVGLSSPDLAKSRSFGIRGLHERASTVGGWVELTSGPQGTTLILSVPLADGIGFSSEFGPDAEEEARGHDEDDPSVWGAP